MHRVCRRCSPTLTQLKREIKAKDAANFSLKIQMSQMQRDMARLKEYEESTKNMHGFSFQDVEKDHCDPDELRIDGFGSYLRVCISSNNTYFLM